MSRWLKLLLFLMLFVTKLATARELAQCSVVAEGPGEPAFLAFDRELKTVLSTQDTAALALLVAFPLRVGWHDGARISLENPAALRVFFQDVFTSEVRDTVLKQDPRTVFCGYDGIMYGDGDVWIRLVGQGEAERYAVSSVNTLQKGAGTSSSPMPKVQFVCNSDRHRILVDVDKEGSIRYRSWNRPRSILEKPDMLVTHGTVQGSGTYPCTHIIWRFERGNTVFSVSEIGCTNETPPEGARGRLSVTVAGETRLESWCY